MARLIFGHDAEVAAWVSEKVGYLISPPFVAIGATKDGQSLCGGAVFNNWNGANIEITLASDSALTRGTIRGVYDYVFNQSKATRVTAHTRRSNKAMRELFPRLGFTFESVAKRFYGPRKADDAFVYALFPDNARKWL